MEAAGFTLSETISAAHILRAIQHSMQNTFLNHLDSVIDFANAIPAYSGNILEWHFVKDTAPFDFAYRVNAEYDKPLLAINLLKPDTSSFIREGYQRLVDCSKNRFSFGIENVWFEYDSPFQGDPAVFIDIHRNSGATPLEKWQAQQTVWQYFNQDLSPSVFQFLNKLHENNLLVVYAGFMFSRTSKALRITISGIEPHRIHKILQRLNWQGNYNVIAAFTKKFIHADQRILLDIDFDGHVAERIGIEIFDKKTDAFIERLYTNKLLKENQYEFLKYWACVTHLEPAVSKALTKLHQRPIQYVYKRNNHFKFVVDGRNLTTKAYLYYCF